MHCCSLGFVRPALRASSLSFAAAFRCPPALGQRGWLCQDWRDNGSFFAVQMHRV